MSRRAPNPPVHRQVSITCLLIGMLKPQPSPPSDQSPTLCSLFLFTMAQGGPRLQIQTPSVSWEAEVKLIQGSVGWLWRVCALSTGAFTFFRAFWSILQFLTYTGITFGSSVLDSPTVPAAFHYSLHEPGLGQYLLF